jgi:membrane protein YqaA with SNARE-associated domain
MAALFLAAALDASFLPFPVTTIFVVLSINRPGNIPTYAFLAVSGTITGAIAGYIAGRFLWTDNVGEFTRLALFFFETIPGFSAENYERLRSLYIQYDQGLIIIASATAIPFGIISVSAGIFKMPAFIFIITALTGQIAKYIFVGFLCQRYGSRALKLLKFNWKPWLVSAAVVMALIAFISKNSGH